MTKSAITFQVRATGPDLFLQVRLDDKEIKKISLSEENQVVTVNFDDDIEQDHLLELEFSGKKSEHTIQNKSGEIIKDRVLELSDFSIDSISLQYILTCVSTYDHDFNGTGESTQEQFYGTMGCNGVVKFRFSSPIYLWLLENM